MFQLWQEALFLLPILHPAWPWCIQTSIWTPSWQASLQDNGSCKILSLCHSVSLILSFFALSLAPLLHFKYPAHGLSMITNTGDYYQISYLFTHPLKPTLIMIANQTTPYALGAPWWAFLLIDRALFPCRMKKRLNWWIFILNYDAKEGLAAMAKLIIKGFVRKHFPEGREERSPNEESCWKCKRNVRQEKGERKESGIKMEKTWRKRKNCGMRLCKL